MKQIFSILLIAMIAVGGTTSCRSTDQYGKELQTPFSGSKYKSSSRYFRAVGKGQSAKENVARKKSDMDARTQLASMVETTVKQVADDYLGSRETVNAQDVMEKFQLLSREVMNTTIGNLQKLDEKIYYNDQKGEYTCFTAYEIHKKDMIEFMRDRAELQQYENESTKNLIQEILDEELKRIEASPEE